MFQNMWMALVFGDAGGFAVFLDELPEALPGDRKQSLISGVIFQEIKHHFSLIQQWILVLEESLCGFEGALQPGDGEMAVREVISLQANDFRRSQTVGKGDQDHHIIAEAVGAGGGEKCEQLIPS